MPNRPAILKTIFRVVAAVIDDDVIIPLAVVISVGVL